MVQVYEITFACEAKPHMARDSVIRLATQHSHCNEGHTILGLQWATTCLWLPFVPKVSVLNILPTKGTWAAVITGSRSLFQYMPRIFFTPSVVY